MCIYIYILYIYIYIYICVCVCVRALRASRACDLDLCNISIAHLLDNVVVLFLPGSTVKSELPQIFSFLIVAFIDPIHGAPAQLSGMRNCSGTLSLIVFIVNC